MRSAPIGFAHRGARDRAPENTLEAFRLALALGATGLESDAWLNAEGAVVLDHDGLVGPPWRRRPISEVGLAALPPHIPTLAALYDACGCNFDLSLDLKAVSSAPAVLAAAQSAGPDARARLWLCHPDADELARIRGLDGRVRLVHSTTVRRGTPAAALAALAGADAQRGIDAINLRAEYWDHATIAAVHGAGLLAFGWDAQREVTLDRLLGAGIDAVYCDHVPRMVTALHRHTLSSERSEPGDSR